MEPMLYPTTTLPNLLYLPNLITPPKIYLSVIVNKSKVCLRTKGQSFTRTRRSIFEK
ncbi:hypothetical protein SCG7086_BE_00090 [Chlamydiales bacterium SCGC AG-110-P3]|nr:hypothetical protein SCG7086_BE_00090 [Chlamydiales bacterium SCGC AG-110-P3]